jgi:hypothetical protein
VTEFFANSPWIAENFNTVQWSKFLLQKKNCSFDSYHFHNRALIVGVEEIQGMGMLLIATYSVYEDTKTALFLHIIFK